MKKLMLIAGMLSLFALQAKNKHEGPCGDTKVKRFVLDSLGLNADQIAKVQAVFDESCLKFKSIKEKAEGDRSKVKEEMLEVRKDMKSKVAIILTEEQKQKLKARFKGEKKKEISPEKMANRMTEIMRDSLGLTNDQVEKVKVVNLEFIQQMQSFKAQKESADKKQNKELRKKNVDDHESKLKGILNASQFQKFVDNKEKRKAMMKENKKLKKP